VNYFVSRHVDSRIQAWYSPRLSACNVHASPKANKRQELHLAAVTGMAKKEIAKETCQG
jgi:hypothetical protein